MSHRPGHLECFAPCRSIDFPSGQVKSGIDAELKKVFSVDAPDIEEVELIPRQQDLEVRRDWHLKKKGAKRRKVSLPTSHLKKTVGREKLMYSCLESLGLLRLAGWLAGRLMLGDRA